MKGANLVTTSPLIKCQLKPEAKSVIIEKKNTLF